MRHSALPWLFQVLETPVLLGLINWYKETVPIKMKLEHEGKIEKEKQLFFLSDILVYLS